MVTDPLVSVVMPCYNTGHVLDETMASIAAQEYRNIEVIIVDDGSTDPVTLERLRYWEERGAATVIHQDNHGPGHALNRALEAAQGVYFLNLGDDLIEPPYVREAVAEMERDPSLGIVYCHADFFGSESGPWRLQEFSMQTQLLNNLIFATALMRRADWAAVGGYDEVMKGREDHDFNLRVLSLGRRVHRLDGVYFHYRRGRPSVNANLHHPDNRALFIDAYARMFRTNTELYREHAEAFMREIFSFVDERNELRLRYRHLERFRSSRAGRRLLGAARWVKSTLRRGPS
ncbi:glycosyltransferase [Tessaracoccus sp. G1721]